MNPIPFPSFIVSEPLAIHGPALAGWLMRHQALAEKAHAAASMQSGESQLSIADFVNQRREYSLAGGIAMIHVNDVLASNTTGIDRMLGSTDYAHLIAELETAAVDPDARAIVCDINSPGGSACGAPEAAAALARATQSKPVVSFIGSMGASAAYYFAAASSAIIASPSATVGSIGTICSFVDVADMLSRIGISPHIVTPAGSDLKATGNQLRAPTLAELNFLQARSEALNADFTAWVQQHRPAATADAMRGQWFTGKEALGNGLVDELGTLADACAAATALAGLR